VLVGKRFLGFFEEFQAIKKVTHVSAPFLRIGADSDPSLI